MIGAIHLFGAIYQSPQYLKLIVNLLYISVAHVPAMELATKIMAIALTPCAKKVITWLKLNKKSENY